MNRRSKIIIFITTVVSSVVCSTAYADNIVIFGASGQFGSHLVREALSRGHNVIGVSRSPEKFDYSEDTFTAVKGNPTELESVNEVIKGADSIVVALGDRVAQTPETTAMNLTAISLSEALKSQGKQGPPVIVLGGGDTSAETEEGMLANLAKRGNGGQVNPRLQQIYLSQWVTYQTYKESNINWTYVATPKNILGLRGGDPARTGKYQAVSDGSLDDDPSTGLSRADIANAMIDFAQSGEFSQSRVLIAQQ